MYIVLGKQNNQSKQARQRKTSQDKKIQTKQDNTFLKQERAIQTKSNQDNSKQFKTNQDETRQSKAK